MKKITQREMILSYLQSRGSINPIIALEELGCFRLATRIFELKEQGYDIKTRMHKYTNSFGQKKKYAIYYLADSNYAKYLEKGE